MKNLLYTFLAFGLFFSCSENKENDLDKVNLKGNVKSIYTTSFEAIEKFGEIEKGDKAREFVWDNDIKTYYNDNGNRIEENQYDEEGELTSKRKYKYDDNGNVIEANQYDEEGELTRKYKYKYDDNGNRIEAKEYDEDGELENESSYEYKFDDKGNWIQQIIFEDDKPTFIIEREIKYYD